MRIVLSRWLCDTKRTAAKLLIVKIPPNGEMFTWWLLPDLNWGHAALQAAALPTELKSQNGICILLELGQSIKGECQCASGLLDGALLLVYAECSYVGNTKKTWVYNR